jgi:competence protein ComEC
LAHLLSISGLHMVLVAGTIVGALRYALALIEPLALRVPARKVAAVVAIAVAAGYMLLAGATVPTQRAFIMIAIALLAVIVDRDPVSMRLLAWAALVVLTLRPESILGASFQLSFAAVTALIAVYETPAVRARLRVAAADDPLRRIGGYVLGVAATTLIASVATTPFAAFHFQTVPTYGVLANLLAVPVTAFWIMPAGLLSVLAMPLGFDAWTVPVMAAGIDVVLWIAHAAASLPGASVALSILPTAFLALVALGGLWLALWQRPWRWAGLAPITFGILLGLAHRPPDFVVAADLQMAAARTATGDLALVEWRGDRMRREQWQRGLGAARLQRVLPLKSAGDELECDPAGCVLRRSGRAVALVRRGDALREDCVRADLVISDVGRCRSGTAFIDGRTARASQGLAIRLLKSGPVVDTVAAHRGQWPWVRAQ